MNNPHFWIDVKLYDKVTISHEASEEKIFVVIGEVKSLDGTSTPIEIEFFPMATDSLRDPLEYSLEYVILNYVELSDVNKVFSRIDKNSIENTKRLLNDLKVNIRKKRNLVNSRISPFFNIYKVI